MMACYARLRFEPDATMLQGETEEQREFLERAQLLEEEMLALNGSMAALNINDIPASVPERPAAMGVGADN